MEHEYTISPATAEEKDLLYSRLQALDPEQKGVTLDKLRVFYPKTGWGVILVTLAGLEEDGRVASRAQGSPVPFQHYTWR